MPVDHHFPLYHLRPPTGYVNDPNGPVLLAGRWHLFFQYTHDTPRRGAVVWGHASSADLVNWRLHRPALSPVPGGADRDGCWSGNTVVAGEELVAFYSGARTGHPHQSVLSARSIDGGHSFGPPTQVITDPDPSEGVVLFRDPFVWQEGDTWLMLVGAGDVAGHASARLYSSADMSTWDYRGPYADLARGEVKTVDTGDMWECPQLLSFGDHDVLLVGAYNFDCGIDQVLAMTGIRTGSRLREPQVSRVDFGRNFYAASALRDSGSGPVMWGWITEGRSATWACAANWSGMISLPRTVSLTADGRLASAPIAALNSMREEALAPRPPAQATEATYEWLPGQFEIEVLLEGHQGVDTAITRLSLWCADDEHLDVVVDWSSGQITVDRDHASRDRRAHAGTYTFEEPTIRTTGALSLRWFIDGSISELFTGSGRCSTVRFYPTAPPPWIVQIAGLTVEDVVQVWTLAALASGEVDTLAAALQFT